MRSAVKRDAGFDPDIIMRKLESSEKFLNEKILCEGEPFSVDEREFRDEFYKRKDELLRKIKKMERKNEYK